jgi:hypothetical protein
MQPSGRKQSPYQVWRADCFFYFPDCMSLPKILSMERDLWEQMPGESTKASRAFQTYLDQGADRSLARVGRELGVSKQLIERWSSRFCWVRRARAWDDDLQAKRRAKFVAETLEMCQRHAAIACLLQQKLIARIQSLTDEEVNDLTPSEIASWLKTSVEVERVSRGLPAQILQPTKKADEEEEGTPEPVEFQETIISTRQDFLEFKKNLRPDQKLLMAP